MAQNEIENEVVEMSVETSSEMDLSEMEPEALEVLHLLQETLRAAELEELTSLEIKESEEHSNFDGREQGDRIELLGKKSLGGIRKIAEYLNPAHKGDGKTLRPQPLLALLRVNNLMYQEIWSQRSRLRTLETAAAQQTATLEAVKNDVRKLVDLFHSDEAET